MKCRISNVEEVVDDCIGRVSYVVTAFPRRRLERDFVLESIVQERMLILCCIALRIGDKPMAYPYVDVDMRCQMRAAAICELWLGVRCEV